MQVTIYQIDMDHDRDHLAFMGWDHLLSHGYKQPPAAAYQAVYTYESEGETLEDIFYRFNVNHPVDYHGRSLTVSDVVELCDDNVKSRFFYCETFGFNEVNFDKSAVRGDLP